MRTIMEQSISNCYLSKMYGNPGMEDGMCAGFCTMDGFGQPCVVCKECKLNFLYNETHNIKESNADKIRSMSDVELANFLEHVENTGYNDQSIAGNLSLIEWLQMDNTKKI